MARAAASSRRPTPGRGRSASASLGRFEIRLYGKPIEFGRKVPRKILALLKALIALGGTAVSESALIDALWPDEEGDAAHGAYTMAIIRLRKLLGESGHARAARRQAFSRPTPLLGRRLGLQRGGRPGDGRRIPKPSWTAKRRH